MNLNKEQKEAVESVDGPLLIIAGPGSGKTRTLIERIVHIVEEKKADLNEILITTFTERAARELLTRITTRLSEKNLNLKDLYIGTIHSICLRIIDEYIEYSRLEKGYRVLDNVDQKLYIFSILKELKKIKNFDKFFSDKNAMGSWRKVDILAKWINRVSEESKEFEIRKSVNWELKFISDVYERYKELLFLENKIDFSMIQTETYRILFENPEILLEIQKKIKYIMVDEYQDTNDIQEKIVFLLGGEKKNICVVGDDDQGIYRFRGATIKNILQFENKIGSECKLVKLETNYRSEKDIVDFCSEWIDSLNWEGYRYSKNLHPSKEKNKDTKRVIKLSVEGSETKWKERIYRFLYFLKHNGKIDDYNQVAFLFRSVRKNKILSLAKYLEENGIAVYSPRSNRFFYREEIKEILGALFYILIEDKKSFFEKNKNTTINSYCMEIKFLFEKLLSKDENLKFEIENLLENFSENKKDYGKILDWYYRILSIDYFKKYFEKEEIGVLENRVLYNFGILSKIIEKCDSFLKVEIVEKENLKKLGNYFFATHLKFLKENGVDEYEDIKEFAPKGAVSFLTIHQSKGLEFPIVIVDSLESTPEKEEDRFIDLERAFKWDNFEPEYRKKDFDFWRLYYTAFSRAQNLLILSCVESNRGKIQVPSAPFKRVYGKLIDAGELEFRNLEIAKIKDIDIKNNYSYTSHYLTYLECPFKYKMEKIFNFQGLKEKNMIFGILIHQVLEYINRKSFQKLEVKYEEICEEYEKLYEIISKSYGVILQEKYLQEGLEYFQSYLEDKDILENIVDIEKSIYVARNNYILEGQLDLVIEKENELYIVDFKTGDFIEGDEIIEKYKGQIEIYSYLLEENIEKEVKGGYIYFLKDRKKIFIPRDIEKQERVLKSFDLVVQEIEKNSFSHRNFGEEKCEKCEFFQYCKKEILR